MQFIKFRKLKNTTRVVIIDHNFRLLEAYSLVINSSEDFEVVATYLHVADLIKRLKKDRPDIVILDIELPNSNGVKGISDIRKEDSEIDIIVNTYSNDIETILKALSAGANGYLLKNLSPLKLMESLQEVKQGGAPLSQQISKLLVSSFHKSVKTPLSDRETQVLGCIVEGKTYSQIANDLNINPNTSKSHIKNIYSKLNVNNKAEAIAVAKSNNFI